MYNVAGVLDKLNFIKISSLVTGACTSKCLVNLQRQQAGVWVVVVCLDMVRHLEHPNDP